MISIEALHKRIRGEQVLRRVDLSVGRGEVVALVGPSGTGKSTLLRIVIGLAQPDGGDVLLDGRSVPRAGSGELAAMRRRVGFAFQDGALLDSLTVYENLRLALDDREFAGQPGAANRRIADTLALVELPSAVMTKYPPQLSGGMRKRVGVARAIVNEPAVLLFDEPTSGLDPRNAQAIHGVVLAARTERRATALIVTHDLAALSDFADRVVLLLRGRVHFDAPPAAFFASAEPGVQSFIGAATRARRELAV